jgi:outer membrane protein TolC
MHWVAAMTYSARRFRVALGSVLLLVCGLVFVPHGTGQQPASVLPPIVPLPATPLTVPTPSLTLPLPGATQPNGPAVRNGQEPTENGVQELTLGQCVAIAVERQPALKAVRASQMGTAGGQQALNNIGRLGERLSPDLPIRREQASRGVVAAAADVQKVHNEVVQDVTRLYYTVVYAGQQEQLAADVVAVLDLLVKIGEKLLASGMPGEMTPQKLNAMKIGLAEARRLQATARQGQKSAHAALREVMAVDEASFPFRVKDTELPVMAQKKELTKETVVSMALAYRPELALAAAGVDAFRLEVYAQGKVPFRRSVPTLASGADIHAREIPTASRGKEYRPGAIVPEMPPQLVGSKYDRVCRAMAYSQRADAVYEKTRNLVSLEAETGFYDFELAAENQQFSQTKSEEGKKLMEWVKTNIDNPKVPKDILVTSYAMAAKAQSDYVEAVYQYLLSLAAIERITAGGVRPAFPGR